MVFRFSLSDLKIVLGDIGEIIFLSGFSFFVPIPFAMWYGEGNQIIFSYVLVGLLTIFFGLFIKKFFSSDDETQLKHAFLTASLVWLLFCFFAALPFVLIHGTSLIDGMFEVMSSLTTAGLSVLEPEIDSVPKSLVFWRSFLGWVGGMGIIVLALVGVVTAYSTSTRLFFAEGRDDRIKPNLKHTVSELWKIYLGITILGIIALLFAGMGVFDAVNYSMSAVSTSGANTSADKLALQPNLLIEIILTVLLVLGSTNFALHYFFVRRKNPSVYLQSTEFKAMILFSIVGGLLVLPKFIELAPTLFGAARYAFFHSFSAQLGGFSALTTNVFANFDDFIKIVFALLMIIGGSSGSTSGGIRVSRFLLILKQFFWKIKQITLPRDSFFPKKFDGVEVEQKQLSEVNHFVLVYIALLFAGTLVLVFVGHSFTDSFFEASSAQANSGLSIGITEKGMPIVSEITLFILMWLGRLDIIPLFSAIGLGLSLAKAKDF